MIDFYFYLLSIPLLFEYLPSPPHKISKNEDSCEIWALIEYETANDHTQQHVKQSTQHPLLPTTEIMAMLHKRISTLDYIRCDTRELLTCPSTC